MSKKDVGQKGENITWFKQGLANRNKRDFKPWSEYCAMDENYGNKGVVPRHILKAIDEYNIQST